MSTATGYGATDIHFGPPSFLPNPPKRPEAVGDDLEQRSIQKPWEYDGERDIYIYKI